MAREEEGLGFLRPSQQRLVSSYHSGLRFLKDNFTSFLGKERVPGGKSKVQPMCLVSIPQPVNTFLGTAEEGPQAIQNRTETRQWRKHAVGAQRINGGAAGSPALSFSPPTVQGRPQASAGSRGSQLQGTSWAPLFAWSPQDRQHGEEGQGSLRTPLPALGVTAGQTHILPGGALDWAP